jgi:hypothetical protein
LIFAELQLINARGSITASGHLLRVRAGASDRKVAPPSGMAGEPVDVFTICSAPVDAVLVNVHVTTWPACTSMLVSPMSDGVPVGASPLEQLPSLSCQPGGMVSTMLYVVPGRRTGGPSFRHS